MATKKEIKLFLKESGYSEIDMQNFWNELLETNTLVKALDSCDKNWTDMNMWCIRDLPTRKQKDEDDRIKKEQELLVEQEKKAKEKAELDYYNEHFEEIMVKKIDSGERLTEAELQKLVWEFEDVEFREYDDNGRWSRGTRSILLLCGRFFEIYWQEGLTEMQDNEFYNQPYEVIKNEREEVVKVVEWVKKG